MTAYFTMQRSHSEELSLKSRRWMSTSEMEWGMELRMMLACRSTVISTWLFLSQMT